MARNEVLEFRGKLVSFFCVWNGFAVLEGDGTALERDFQLIRPCRDTVSDSSITRVHLQNTWKAYMIAR